MRLVLSGTVLPGQLEPAQWLMGPWAAAEGVESLVGRKTVNQIVLEAEQGAAAVEDGRVRP
jgi:hypothetical protein